MTEWEPGDPWYQNPKYSGPLCALVFAVIFFVIAAGMMFPNGL